MLFDILQQRRIIVIGGGSDFLNIAMGSIEESSGLPQHTSPFNQFNFTLLQGLVGIVQRCHTLFEGLASVGKLVDFGSGRGS